MNRGTISGVGTAVAATDQDASAYLDFVEGARLFLNTQLLPHVKDQATAALSKAETDQPGFLQDIDNVWNAASTLPLARASGRIERSVQEMMWAEVVETLERRKDELLAELDAADRRGPGSVQYLPDFPYPAYFDGIDFHLQPGSYHRNPLAGYIYHLGTKYYLCGVNDDDQLQRGVVATVPPPPDGTVRRVLDLGCSVGQCTTAFKERFPDAEVWGLDVSEPMVRYAHKRAVEMGLAIHVKQGLAEATGFPDGSFDLVFANILFHELPTPVALQVLREGRRILRPGGMFVFVDIEDDSHFGSNAPDLAFIAFRRRLQAMANEERYHPEYQHTHFGELLGQAGFRNIVNDFHGLGWHPGLVMPMRVAEK